MIEPRASTWMQKLRAERRDPPAAYDEADAIERMLDDGAPAVVRGGRLNHGSMQLMAEPSAEERAAQRRAARWRYRLYCLACGRSVEISTVPAFGSRCGHCGGTLLVEPTAD